MHTYPPFGRGFGFRPGPGIYYSHGNSALAWATFALVLLLVLVVFAMLVARFSRGRRGFDGPRMLMHHGGPPDPLEVLRMRFASGQISRDEFLQAAGDLTAAPSPSG